jgi:hypothetical protein
MADQHLDCRLRTTGREQAAEEVLLVAAEALDVERRRQALLAAEVVVDAACARAGGLADVLDGGCREALLDEGLERRREDLLPTCGGHRRIH